MPMQNKRVDTGAMARACDAAAKTASHLLELGIFSEAECASIQTARDSARAKAKALRDGSYAV